MESLKYKGSQDATQKFHPGINHVSVDGPVCITYIDRDGSLSNAFVIDTGFHFVRVPSGVQVLVECDESVSWDVKIYDPHEHPDPTPVEVTVVRPRSIKDELKEYAAAMVAKALGVNKDDLETESDMQDFDVDDSDDSPVTIHEIRAMPIDGQPSAQQVEDRIPPTVEIPVSEAPVE